MDTFYPWAVGAGSAYLGVLRGMPRPLLGLVAIPIEATFNPSGLGVGSGLEAGVEAGVEAGTDGELRLAGLGFGPGSGLGSGSRLGLGLGKFSAKCNHTVLRTCGW